MRTIKKWTNEQSLSFDQIQDHRGDGQDKSIPKWDDPAFNPNSKFRHKAKNTARRIDKSAKFPIMSKDAMRIKKIGENEIVVTSILWKHNKDHTKPKELEMNWKHQCWKRNKKT